MPCLGQLDGRKNPSSQPYAQVFQSHFFKKGEGKMVKALKNGSQQFARTPFTKKKTQQEVGTTSETLKYTKHACGYSIRGKKDAVM